MSSIDFTMKNRFRCWVLAGFILLTGCAAQNLSQHEGFRRGFKETRLDDTTYRVSFSGNGNTSGEMVWYYWIYRCAELTKEKGYTGFSLISDRPKAPKAVRHDDNHPIESTSALGRQKDASAYSPARGPVIFYFTHGYSAGSTIYTASAFVRFVNEPAPAVGEYLRAQAIIDSLNEFISSEGQSKPPTKKELFDRSIVQSGGLDLKDLPNSAGGTTLDDLKSLLPEAKR
jgi:hypothetical protein